MTLRVKVVAICMAVTAVVVIVAGAALVSVVSNDLHDRTDRTLRQISLNFTPQTVNALATDSGNAERAAELLGGNPARGVFRNEVVFRLGQVPDVAFARTIGFDTVSVGGENVRRFAREVRSNRGVATVEVFTSLSPIEDRVAFVRNRAILIGAIAVSVAGMLGAILGRAITRPLQRLRDATRSVRGADDLGRRIDIGSSSREVGELVVVMNGMLDRLDQESGRTRQSLEAARAFASDATHELRTPLTAVANNVEILLRHPELSDEERREILEEITERQAVVTQVLGALRDLARGDLPIESDWEQVDLAEVVDSAIAALPDDATVAIEFLASDEHVVNGWPDGLRIMVDNLLANAVTHGRALDGRARIEIRVTGSSEGVVVEVLDSGLGIARADAERLQRRYERGDSPSAGTGLGLSMVRQQVDLHRGRLEISRSHLGGARVAVIIPT